jgi:hypothetical protein
VWQYGSDLLSHEMALRAAAAPSDGPNLFSSRRKLVDQALGGRFDNNEVHDCLFPFVSVDINFY